MGVAKNPAAPLLLFLLVPCRVVKLHHTQTTAKTKLINEQATASTVTCDYFSCSTKETTCVFDKSFQQVPLVIALDFRYIELQSWESTFHQLEKYHHETSHIFDTVSSSLQAICESESQEERKSKSTELVGRMLVFKQNQELKVSKEQQKTPIISHNEDFLNLYLIDRITEAAEGSGFIVMTNKSVTGIKTSLSPSRLETSRPDLLMYSKTSYTGIVTKGVNEEGEENQEGEEERGGEEDGGGEEKKERKKKEKKLTIGGREEKKKLTIGGREEEKKKLTIGGREEKKLTIGGRGEEKKLMIGGRGEEKKKK